MKWCVVKTRAHFKAVIKGWTGLLSVDTETYGSFYEPSFKVLGLSLSPENANGGLEGIYISFNQYSFESKVWCSPADRELVSFLKTWLPSQSLVGHNFTYDKRALQVAGIETNWVFDTRIGWHLSSAPAGPRPYGLKDLQKELLGWAESNDKELEQDVKSKGGSLKKGDHYLATLPILAKYACLDTYSTIEGYKAMHSWFMKHEYMPMMTRIMAYNQLLDDNTYRGIDVDKEGLLRAHSRLLQVKEASKRRFLKLVKKEVAELEMDWLEIRTSKLKRPSAITLIRENQDRWERLNLNSDKHKRELFYRKLRFPILDKTDSGQASTSADSIKFNKHPAMESYLKYEKANTLSTSFTSAYLSSLDSNSRLHPGFNICGTVSYRLSGFKPYLLNAPFDEKAIMRHLRLEEGEIGVHADLSAIEPTLTAHYSEDPSLLKVFRDGLGDIYLDLALELFPNDKELQDGYDPHVPIDKAMKERFSRQRKVAKVIQLAVQYGGTGHTVAKNLTKDSIPTTVEEADNYVRAYWSKFSAVRRFNYQLSEVNRKDGLMRNVIGRIIRVPDPDYKDLPNRFIQSGAHDVLMLWVLRIYELCKEYGIPIRPILLDCHDSTSNATDRENGPTLIKIYDEALADINKLLKLSVTIKAESKFFTTLAGLKGAE